MVSNVAIPMVMLLLTIAFLGFFLYYLFKDKFAIVYRGPFSKNKNITGTTNNNTESNALQDSVNFYLPCNPGQCPTNIQTGVKTCPLNDSITLYADPLTQVCNSRYLCDNPLTPYALQLDGSTNPQGSCEPGLECPCFRHGQCPSYILSAFTSFSGNAFNDFKNQRSLLPQVSSYSLNGNQSNVPPIEFQSNNFIFCTAPFNWLAFSSPGCGFINGFGDISLQEIELCMGMASGCSGLYGSPCAQGTLAFISKDAAAVKAEDLKNLSVGCVTGNSCPCGSIAFYDTNYGGIVCRKI